MSADNEKNNPPNPLGMVPDRYDGITFVLPPTACTEERRLFLRRTNEILGFLFVTCLCYKEYRRQFEKIIPDMPFKDATPIKITLKSKMSMMQASRVLSLMKECIDVIARQSFIMIYGSFETYLYALFERSFPYVGVKVDIFEKSLEILMKGRWDGKFCKIGQIFDIEYKAGQLMGHFSDFKMDFEGKIYKNPLDFLDEIAKVRHRIVHASSILENDKMIYVDVDILPVFVGFYNHLTDYIDNMFATRFGYLRTVLNPAEA